MNETGKNKYVEDILNSLDGMQRAEPGAGLYDKIEGRLSGKAATTIIPLRRVSFAAACVLLLIAVNIIFMSMQHTKKDNSMLEVASFYQLTNNNPLDNL